MMLAVAAVVGMAAPAAAQTARDLSDGVWDCRMTSLVGEPGMDLQMTFARNGDFGGWFYFEMEEDGDTIGVEFEVGGAWRLNGPVIATSVNWSNVLGATLNGERLADSVVDTMADTMGEELSSFAGESTIAFMADHAMVLDEPGASISCWR